MFKQRTLTIQDLSAHLFWDVNPDSLDMEKDFRFVLTRVLGYGVMKDWMQLFEHFGIERIASEAKRIRSLDDKSLHFIAHMSGSNLEEFKCYTYKQSIAKHWDF
jgi:hypothetical protein